MRAALYTRVSTRDKGQETTNQLRELREFCATQGWSIVQEYEDHESGGKADRAQFKGMMADAAQRKFDVLLFWALDRLSREGVYETHTYLKRLDDFGVRLPSPDLVPWSRPESRLQARSPVGSPGLVSLLGIEDPICSLRDAGIRRL
jgi:DNA invertase Pin-like site-specific DNA recombinase